MASFVPYIPFATQHIGRWMLGASVASAGGIAVHQNMKKGYTPSDAAQDTGVSEKEVREAWHQAREDAQRAGELPERKVRKERQRKNK